jgi:hypothetical protein
MEFSSSRLSTRGPPALAENNCPSRALFVAATHASPSACNECKSRNKNLPCRGNCCNTSGPIHCVCRALNSAAPRQPNAAEKLKVTHVLTKLNRRSWIIWVSLLWTRKIGSHHHHGLYGAISQSMTTFNALIIIITDCTALYHKV